MSDYVTHQQVASEVTEKSYAWFFYTFLHDLNTARKTSSVGCTIEHIGNQGG